MNRPSLFSATILAALALWGTSCGHSGGTPPTATAVPSASYGQDLIVLAVGEALAPLTPTSSGGVTSWSIDPALPAGLAFDAATGEISGTPTARSPLALHRVEASNILGSDIVELGVRVLGSTRFAYGGSAVDGSVASFAALDGGTDLQHLGWASVTESVTDDLVADPHGRYLGSVDDFDLITYLVDATTGQPSLGAAASLGSSGPHDLDVHPSGDYAFVTSRGTGRIHSYSIDPGLGTPTLVVWRSTGPQPELQTMDPLGRWVIVAHNYDESVPGEEKTLLASYLIDDTTGDLTPSVALDLLLSDVTAMAASQDGRHLYLLLSTPFPTVLHCAVDPSTGQPSLVTTANAGTTPTALAVTPRGDRLYVANQGSDDVTIFDLDQEDGSLVATASFGASAGVDALSFSDDGSTLFVLDSTAREVTVHVLDPATGGSLSSAVYRTRSGSGALTQIAGDAPLMPRAVDLYAATVGLDQVLSFTVEEADGSLTPNGQLSLAASTDPRALAVDPRGRFVFVAAAAPDELHTFVVQSGGELQDLGAPTAVASGVPLLVTTDPAGQFVYTAVEVTDAADQLHAYQVAADGSLSFHSSLPIAENPRSVTVDPTGTFVFVTLGGDGVTELGEILSFAINSQNGILIALPTMAADGHPTSLTFDSYGLRAYVTFRDTDIVLPYEVATNGTLTPIGTGSLAQNEPREVRLTRDGRFAYAVFEDSSSFGGLLLYDVNPISFELFNSDNQTDQWRDSVPAGTQPEALELSPDGSRVYVMARVSEELHVLTADAVTGLTTPLEIELLSLEPVSMGLRVLLE